MLHLVHPALVHFSVALLIVGGITETAGILGRSERTLRVGGAAVLLGTCSLPPTIVSGFVAECSMTLPEGAGRLLDRHEIVGLLVLAVFLVGQLVRAWDAGEIRGARARLYVALLLAGVALVAYGAFLGGEMVYGLGVGVIGR